MISRHAGQAFLTAAILLLGIQCTNAGTVNVTTYHNDNLRTGWNSSETALTPSAVSGGTFKSIASVALDDQVDAQPLIVTNQQITGQGTHDVVYVATESNTIYALDAASGQILLQQNFGPPRSAIGAPGVLRKQRAECRHQLHAGHRSEIRNALRGDLHL